MNPIILPWIAEIAIIAWRSLTGVHYKIETAGGPKGTVGGPAASGVNLPGKVTAVSGPSRPPLPSELLSSFVIFGVYAAIAEKDARIGQLLAWGTVLATGLMFLSKGSPEQEQLNPRQNQNLLTQYGALGAQTPQSSGGYAMYYPYPQAQSGQGGY